MNDDPKRKLRVTVEVDEELWKAAVKVGEKLDVPAREVIQAVARVGLSLEVNLIQEGILRRLAEWKAKA